MKLPSSKVGMPVILTFENYNLYAWFKGRLICLYLLLLSV